MKKVAIILFLVTVAFSELSAQDNGWSDVYNFEMTVYKDSSLFKSSMGSRSVYAKNGDAVYHSMYINNTNDSIEDMIIGKVYDYKYTKEKITLLDNDFSITKFVVDFKWECNYKNGIKDTAVVRQMFFNSDDTGFSILVERVDFSRGGSFLSWGGREPYQTTKNETKLSLPVMFRIKRISTSEDVKDDLKNPDEIVTYAEWTDKGLFRYSVTGEKDSLMFGGPAEREMSLKYYETVIFPNTEGEHFLFSNFYYHSEPHEYVSTMDMYPFPYNGEGLESFNKTHKSIFWEKMNLNIEFAKVIMKLSLIGKDLMTESDYNLLTKKVSLLLKFANDSDLRKIKRN